MAAWRSISLWRSPSPPLPSFLANARRRRRLLLPPRLGLQGRAGSRRGGGAATVEDVEPKASLARLIRTNFAEFGAAVDESSGATGARRNCRHLEIF